MKLSKNFLEKKIELDSIALGSIVMLISAIVNIIVSQKII